MAEFTGNICSEDGIWHPLKIESRKCGISDDASFKDIVMDMVSTGTDFSNASLNGSEFDLTSLYDVDLSGADMTDASFSRLALIGCNLSGIKLIGIKNYESILQFLAEADLQGAEMSDDLLLNIQEIRSLRSHS